MTLPDDARVQQLLHHATNPYALHWAIRKAARRLEAGAWIHATLQAFRTHPSLNHTLFHALKRASWSDLRAPLGPLLFDESLPESTRTLLWIFWAQNEEVVPDCPGDEQSLDSYDLTEFNRAEQSFFRQFSNEEGRAALLLASEDEPPIDTLIETMLQLDVADTIEVWRLLTEPLGDAEAFQHDDREPDPSVLDRLSTPLRHRADSILSSLKQYNANPAYHSSLLLAIEEQQRNANLSFAERCELQGGEEIDTDTLLTQLQSEFADPDELLSLAKGLAPSIDTGLFLKLFAALETEHLASLLLEHSNHSVSAEPLTDDLLGIPGLLERVAPIFVLGPHAEDTLEAMADADADWAVELLLEQADEILGRLVDEEMFWNAVVGLADDRLLPVCERYSLPWHSTRAWAWHTLAELVQADLPPVDEWLPDDETIIEHPTTLRVHCECGIFTTHPVSGLTATLPEIPRQFGHTPPEDWDGIMPNEVLTCPACSTPDAYTVDEDTVFRLSQIGANRSLPAPTRRFPIGISATPRIFAGVLATRPSRTEANLQEQLSETPSAELTKEWFSFLFTTQQFDRLLTETISAFELYPSDGKLRWYTALAAEQTGDLDRAVAEARRGLPLCSEVGPIEDLVGMLVDLGKVEALEIRWLFEGRTLSGILDLVTVSPTDTTAFLIQIEITHLQPCSPGDAGWVERWLEGERPPSKAEQLRQKKKKTALRKKKKARRKR